MTVARQPGAGADVVIVGSGAGGAAAAWALSRSGLKVLVLESGPAFDPLADYRLAQPRWEQDGFPAKPGSSFRTTFDGLQALDPRHDTLATWNHNFGRAVTDGRRRALAYHHVRGVGGSTLHFTGEAHRLHPQAMRMRSRFGVAADWPLDYRELEPFYLQAEQALGVAGGGPDGARWRSQPHPLPAHPHSHASQLMGRACAQLGLGWQPNSLAVLSRPHEGRPGCNYCGQCNRGCPRGDKGSADVTFLAQARATGRCTVLPEAHVTRLDAGPGDRVARVSWIDRAGQTHSLEPRVLVLAAGAVHTPRLLLLSQGPRAEAGLANESGQVGRNLMETLSWVSSALHPERLGSHRGLPSDGICWDLNAPDAIPGVVGGCRFTLGMAEADLAGPINYARRVVPGWGRAHRQGMKDSFGRVLSVASIGEFLPNDGSYVDLDPDVRDAFGQPVARLRSRLAEADIDRLLAMAARCRALLAAAGAGRPFEENGSWDTFSATHVFGTCRMGTTADRSVVDRDGRSHRWRNLYVADASVFPSSGGGEAPSLTIQALAIRSAGRIRSRLLAREL